MTVNQLSDKLALSRLYDRGEDDIMVSLGNGKYAHIVDVVPFKTTVVIQTEDSTDHTTTKTRDMERKIRIEKTIDLATAECQIFARYWEDSKLNGIKDDASNPQMPCVESVEHFYYGKEQLAWCPIIDLDNGRILNWPVGEVAKIHYKSCDENVVIIKDRNGEEVKDYTGYVPRFLDPYRDGYGDYVIMEVDSNGYIRDFDNDLDDILDDDED